MTETQLDKMEFRLKKIREALGLSQGEMSKRLGVLSNNYNQLELQKRNVGPRILNTIIREFNVNPVWFKTGEGEMFKGALVDVEGVKLANEESATYKTKLDEIQELGRKKLGKDKSKEKEGVPYYDSDIAATPDAVMYNDTDNRNIDR